MPAPSPKKGEDKTEWMSRCVPFFIKDDTTKGGKAAQQKQAVAICASMYERQSAKKYEDLWVERECEVLPSGFLKKKEE